MFNFPDDPRKEESEERPTSIKTEKDDSVEESKVMSERLQSIKTEKDTSVL